MPDEMKTWGDRIKGKKTVEPTKGENSFPPFFKFEETGDCISGKLSEPRTIETDYNPNQRIVNITDDNTKEVFSISLSSELGALWELAEQGKWVALKYLGRERFPGKKYYRKNFEIYSE